MERVDARITNLWDLLLGFHSVEALKKEHPNEWKPILSQFGKGGICWALAVTNAVSVVRSLAGDPVKSTDTLKDLLIATGRDVSSYPDLLRTVLMGEVPYFVDSVSGGTSTTLFSHFAAINPLLIDLFGVELTLARGITTNSLGQILLVNPFVPMIVPQVVVTRQGNFGHVATCVSSPKITIFFEPNEADPLFIATPSIATERAIYEDEARQVRYFWAANHPILLMKRST